MKINDTKGATILIDTFCATGCTYCELSTHKKNQFELPYESLDSYMSVVKPESIIIFGGDTFYDHDNITRAYKYACSLDHVKSVKSISEIQKIERDFDIRVKVAKICKDNNKHCGISFSLDIGGKKTGIYVDSLNALYRETGITITFDSVITVNDVNTDGIARLKQLISEYNGLEFKSFFNIILDYRAVTTKDIDPEKLQEFVNELLDMITTYDNKLLLLLRQNTCSVRGGMGDLINQQGRLSTCGKVRPEYDMDYINVSEIKTDIDYLRLKEFKYKFRKKTFNNTCAECPARIICCRCPKFVNLIDGKVGETDTCLFYKTLYRTIVNRNLSDLVIPKKVLVNE